MTGMNMTRVSPSTIVLRAKVAWNLHCRRTGKYHNRVCMGATFCLRWTVYDGACYRHQNVYDRQAARRIKRARQAIAKRHRTRLRRTELVAAGLNPSGRY